ncbi:MAG: LynF/TruF/PatF family peptide O-prenyltransferase [Microcystis wesenbergii Mw_QC_S_20081001_S30D]|uniref:LynF/TruF/PatF family peptide O-prenyltransferase n=1 Tax=Microcystis wesenbergii Mw_QC_S_20081001_S30D TaxID=2486245 RepID=A0A552J911_9CHRO|nr:MAG: LynF/TruF/PatF family peptide O-prenyltransferase [Microcystis wesenbergii Mw_QC_S_20081001_S30D]TRV00493.1 MAG: LynF/TruF/PatF family peptide O-prenyltransferase [Microcystis wesenbergii Mw_QC_S_20081001_S30]
MIVAEIQKNSLKEQRIQFIRNHQQAFDVEPIYPLRLFENFVMSVEGDCTIEASCKIELDKLIASRFMLFFKDQAQEWEKYLTQSLAFFRQVENRVGVQLYYSLLQKFLGHNFDFSKLEVLSAGLDLRTNLADSSLKIHIRIKDYPEKLKTAFVLSNGAADSDYLSKFVELIGFDFYFNGKSEIEIYAELQEDDFFRPETINLVWRHFPDSVLKPLQGSNMFFTGLSKANNNPVLYYHLNNRQDLTNYFKINDTAQRVHSFYQHQDILPNMWVGTTQKELEKTRIENIRLYYYKSFKME